MFSEAQDVMRSQTDEDSTGTATGVAAGAGGMEGNGFDMMSKLLKGNVSEGGD